MNNRKYAITFTGRVKGAIGVMHHCYHVIEAIDKQSAIIELYKYYDCVLLPKCIDITEKE